MEYQFGNVAYCRAAKCRRVERGFATLGNHIVLADNLTSGSAVCSSADTGETAAKLIINNANRFKQISCYRCFHNSLHRSP